jgi:glycosyltransferase involved in cell wall biosynthesis
MKISVIVCTYNRAASLGKALDSIAASKLPDSTEWEVLVVDNNSNDRTRETVEEFCRRHSDHFRYVFEPKSGKTNALNRGINESTGDVLAFTDDDVVVSPVWLRALTAHLDENWAGAAGRIVLEEPFSLPRWIPRNGQYALAPLTVFDPAIGAGPLNDTPFGANMAYQRRVFQQYGEFRTDLGPGLGSNIPQKSEDSEFGHRLLAAGEPLRYEPNAVVYHSLPPNRLTKNYFLAWWYDKARADIRAFGLPPENGTSIAGVPLVFLRRVGMSALRWMVAIEPARRIGRKVKVWARAAEVIESYRIGREKAAQNSAQTAASPSDSRSDIPANSSDAPQYKQTRIWSWARQNQIGEWGRAIRGCHHELWAWAKYQNEASPDIGALTQALAAMDERSSNSTRESSTESPVFLLATGWRSGSTLLQRVLVTDPTLLLWGEPLGEMALLSRITEMMAHFMSERNLKLWRDQDTAASTSELLSQSWIANLYPPGDDFKSALRSLVDRWLQAPARERGFARWGLKEVRMDASDAMLLHWLYPQAKFVFQSRHPYDCYRSLADSGWKQVYDRYPELPVDSAASFAGHWNRLALSWSRLPADFPYVQVKYEDMIAGKVDFRELESWLGMRLHEDKALSASVGGTATRSRLSWHERMIIAHEAGAGMDFLGYSK